MFIGQCIESVLAQTYPYWELIIIDDGSIDGTAEVVERYKDERIKYIQQKNAGIFKLGETYNKVLSISRGELIAVLEGDDFWPANKLEKQIPAFINPEIVLCFGKAVNVNIEGTHMFSTPENIEKYETMPKSRLIGELIYRDFITACTVICRKDRLLSIGGFRQPTGCPYVDYPTWLELILIGDFLPINDTLGYWRRHNRQVTTSMVLEMATSYKFIIDFYDKLPRDLVHSLKMQGITENALYKTYHVGIACGYLYSGRINLIKGNWNIARIDFTEAFAKGTYYLKLIALLCILCSLIKIDMEGFAKIMGKHLLNYEEYTRPTIKVILKPE